MRTAGYSAFTNTLSSGIFSIGGSESGSSEGGWACAMREREMHSRTSIIKGMNVFELSGFMISFF
jgi:hypothetical protein